MIELDDKITMANHPLNTFFDVCHEQWISQEPNQPYFDMLRDLPWHLRIRRTLQVPMDAEL